MKLPFPNTPYLTIILAAVMCLLQGCFSQQAPFVLQTVAAEPPFVYEATCKVPDGKDYDIGYEIRLLFGNRPMEGISGMDIVSSNDGVEYHEIGANTISTDNNDNSTIPTAFGKHIAPAGGLHVNFNHGTSFELNRYLILRSFYLKPNSMLTVRIYMSEKLEPVNAYIDVRIAPKHTFDF